LLDSKIYKAVKQIKAYAQSHMLANNSLQKSTSTI